LNHDCLCARSSRALRHLGQFLAENTRRSQDCVSGSGALAAPRTSCAQHTSSGWYAAHFHPSSGFTTRSSCFPKGGEVRAATPAGVEEAVAPQATAAPLSWTCVRSGSSQTQRDSQRSRLILRGRRKCVLTTSCLLRLIEIGFPPSREPEHESELVVLGARPLARPMYLLVVLGAWPLAWSMYLHSLF
jgi:hypothetical protein